MGEMMEHITIGQYVNNGKWMSAKEELLAALDAGKWDDELAVYAAAIAWHGGDKELAYDYIREGLIYNYKNYELYLMLGDYYAEKNINQAWLCYENAEYYCNDEQDAGVILQRKKRMEQLAGWSVQRVSIVVLTYNTKALNIQCIESIRNTNMPSSYELIVVDNASSDGTVEWLNEQKDIRLICNRENKGFPEGCNQGIKASEGNNDILLLNSDTIVLPNSIFWLRMGLYEEERIGATGSVSNNAGNEQVIGQKLNGVQEYIAYGTAHNVPIRYPYEKKVYLGGFAMLIKRKALDEVGILDTRFFPGQSEDIDLAVRLNYAGWKLILCWNSFIVHYGQGNGQNTEVWESTYKDNDNIFRKKWNFWLHYYTFPRQQMIDMIEESKEAPISVLEVGCGCGATLARIEHVWPHATVTGVELECSIAKLGANSLDIIQGNIESMNLPYEEKSFDYIILADVLEHLHDPEAALRKLIPYLKDTGKFLCSIPNIMNQNVIAKLLMGKFEYEDAGILDRTHIRFFTLESIRQMLDTCGLEVGCLNVTCNQEPDNQEERELLEALWEIPHLAERELFEAYQFVFSAGRKNLLKELPFCTTAVR